MRRQLLRILSISLAMISFSPYRVASQGDEVRGDDEDLLSKIKERDASFAMVRLQINQTRHESYDPAAKLRASAFRDSKIGRSTLREKLGTEADQAITLAIKKVLRGIVCAGDNTVIRSVDSCFRGWPEF